MAEGTVTEEEYMQKLDKFVTQKTNIVKQNNFQYQLRQSFDQIAPYYQKKNKTKKNKIFIKTPSYHIYLDYTKMGGAFKFMKEEEILGILPLHIRTIIKQADINWDDLQEICLRIQKPVIFKIQKKPVTSSEQERSGNKKRTITYRNLTRDQTSHGIYQQLFDVCLYRTVKTRIFNDPRRTPSWSGGNRCHGP